MALKRGGISGPQASFWPRRRTMCWPQPPNKSVNPTARPAGLTAGYLNRNPHQPHLFRPHPGPMHNIFTTPFAKVYPLYVQKAERKGRTKGEVDQVICWLTGYDAAGLQRALDAERDFETFFHEAPAMHPNTSLITGVVCGVRVEDVEDPLMQKIRWLDKLVDELAKAKAMEKILRQ